MKTPLVHPALDERVSAFRLSVHFFLFFFPPLSPFKLRCVRFPQDPFHLLFSLFFIIDECAREAHSCFNCSLFIYFCAFIRMAGSAVGQGREVPAAIATIFFFFPSAFLLLLGVSTVFEKTLLVRVSPFFPVLPPPQQPVLSRLLRSL